MAPEPTPEGGAGGLGPPAQPPRASRLKRIGAVAASLVFPGLGQLVNGHWLRGAVFAALAAGCLWGVVTEAAGVVDEALTALGRADSPEQLARLTEGGRALGLLGWNVGLLATVGLSVWDAWRGSVGRRA